MTYEEHFKRFAEARDAMLAPIVDRCFKLVVRKHLLRNKSHRVKVQTKRWLRNSEKIIMAETPELCRELAKADVDLMATGTSCVTIGPDGVKHVPFPDIHELSGAARTNEG